MHKMQKEGRKERVIAEGKKSGGSSQIAMKPGTAASRGFRITNGPPMAVLLVFLSLVSSMNIHSSIHRLRLANSYFKELRTRMKSGPPIATFNKYVR